MRQRTFIEQAAADFADAAFDAPMSFPLRFEVPVASFAFPVSIPADAIRLAILPANEIEPGRGPAPKGRIPGQTYH